MIIYDIQQVGNNEILFNETVSVAGPFFILVLTNPWTAEQKVATIQPDGSDGERILNIVGTTQPYEDLLAGLIEFENIGTWNCVVYLNTQIEANLLRTISLQIIES